MCVLVLALALTTFVGGVREIIIPFWVYWYTSKIMGWVRRSKFLPVLTFWGSVTARCAKTKHLEGWRNWRGILTGLYLDQ